MDRYEEGFHDGRISGLASGMIGSHERDDVLRAAAQLVDQPDGRVLFGELWLDAEGEAHFICHTKDEDFLKTKTAFEKFIAILQRQIAKERECPFYQSAGVQTNGR